jgi:hypothetical protein
MAAEYSLMPTDQDRLSDVSEVLEKNPDIQKMVEIVAGHAASWFKWMTVELDTRRYDDWDPPLRLTIRTPYLGEEEWAHQYIEFVTWVAHHKDYDPDRLGVMVLAQKLQGSPE